MSCVPRRGGMVRTAVHGQNRWPLGEWIAFVRARRGRSSVGTRTDGEPVPKDLPPAVPLMSPMCLLVPRAALWSALDHPPKRAVRLLPALAGHSVASYTGPRDSVPPPALLGSGCGVLPRATLCLVVVDTPCGLPVRPRPFVSVVDTARSPPG